MVSDTQAVPSSRDRNQPFRVCQRASEQTRRDERPLWPQRYISCCHFTHFSDCIVREEGTIMWWRGAEYSQSLFGELARGSKILTVQLWRESKPGPQCSMARTSRYCVTLWEILWAAVWHCPQQQVIQCYFLHETSASLTLSLLSAEAQSRFTTQLQTHNINSGMECAGLILDKRCQRFIY